MDDLAMLDALERHAGNGVRAARLIGVLQQTWANWRARGVSPEGRLLVWLALQPAGRRMLKRFRAEHAKPRPGAELPAYTRPASDWP